MRGAALVGLVAAGTIAIVILIVRPSGIAPSEERSHTGPATRQAIATFDRFRVLKPATPARMASFPRRAQALLMDLAMRRTLPMGNGSPSVLGIVRLLDGTSVRLVGVGRTICTFTNSDASCDRASRAAAMQSFSAQAIGCRRYRIRILVPDGITRLSVDSGGDGSIEAVQPVTSNVMQLTLKPTNTLLTGTGKPDIRMQVRLPLRNYARTNPACTKALPPTTANIARK